MTIDAEKTEEEKIPLTVSLSAQNPLAQSYSQGEQKATFLAVDITNTSKTEIVKFEEFTITVNPGETVTIELYAHIAQTAVIGNEHSFELTSIYSDADSVT